MLRFLDRRILERDLVRNPFLEQEIGRLHPRVVMEVLGHAQMRTTTDTYSHVMPALGRDAVVVRGGAAVPVGVVGLGVRRGAEDEGGAEGAAREALSHWRAATTRSKSASPSRTWSALPLVWRPRARNRSPSRRLAF